MKVQILQRTTYRIELTEDEAVILKTLTQNAVAECEDADVTAFRAAVWETLPSTIKPR
jgi:hypothetical protein